MNNVVRFTGVTRLDLNPDDVLREQEGLFQQVFILGWDKNGDFRAASSTGEIAQLLHMLELGKRVIFDDDNTEC